MSWLAPGIETGPQPGPRGGHAMAAIGSLVVVTGGANREPKVLADTWLLTTDQEPYRWEQIPQASVSSQAQTDGVQRPVTSLDARTGAAIAALEDRVLLFGGYDPTTGAGFNDVASFDIESRSWTPLQTQGKPPPPTHSHTATFIPRQTGREGAGAVIFFGGATEEGCSNAVHAFDPETSTWSQPTTSGLGPSPREMHSATRLSWSRILIAGGRGSDGTVLSDGAILDTDTWRWEPCKLPRKAFPRCAHSLSSGPGALKMYGGFTGEDVDGLLFSLDPETLDASIICDAASAAASASRFGSSLPPPRFAHSAICIPRPQKKGEAGHQTGTTPLLLVFGGVNPLEDLNGVVVWDQDREGCKADEGDSASRTPLYLQEVTS